MPEQSRPQPRQQLAPAAHQPLRPLDEIIPCGDPTVQDALREGKLPNRDDFVRTAAELRLSPEQMRRIYPGASGLYFSPGSIEYLFGRGGSSEMVRSPSDPGDRALVQHLNERGLVQSTRVPGIADAERHVVNDELRRSGLIVVSAEAGRNALEHERQHRYFDLNPVVQCAELAAWRAMAPAAQVLRVIETARAGGKRQYYRDANPDERDGVGFRFFLAEFSADRAEGKVPDGIERATPSPTLEALREEVLELARKNGMMGNFGKRVLGKLGPYRNALVESVDIDGESLRIRLDNRVDIRATPDDPSRVTSGTLFFVKKSE